MSPRTRQLLLIVGIVALVALAGCGDDLGGPDNDVDEEGEQLEDVEELDDEANETDGDGTDDGAGNETDGADSGDSDANETDVVDLNGEETDGDEDSDAESGDGDAGSDDSAADGTEEDEGEADETDDSERDGGAGDDEPAEPGQSLLTLTVVDEDDEPIEGVTVEGLGEPHEADIPLEFSGETDENGQYTDVIYENEYTIDLDHEAYNATTVEHTHDGEREVTVTLEFEGEETGELAFEVLETAHGGPAEGVEIAGEREEPGVDGEPVTFTAETDDDGMAVVDAPYGTYDVTLDGERYESLEGQVEHRETEGWTPPALFEINPVLPEHNFTVNVVDEDGEPVNGVDVEGTNEPYYADQNESFEVTGVDGSTTITTLSEGMVTVTVTPTETDHEPETVGVSLRQDEEITVVLRPSGND